MKLMHHLNDEELTDLLLESDQRELEHALAELPEWLRASAQQPELFWRKQQAAIRGRIVAARRIVWPILAASAGALALLVFAFALLHEGAPAPPVPTAQTVSDQDLMIAVEQDVQTSVPEALAPASLLADEISNAQSASGTSHSAKENKHEN